MATVDTNNRPLPSFLGINWGASRQEVRSAMEAKEGVLFSEAQSGESNLVFGGGLFANREVNMWVLQFVNDQLHTAKILIAPPIPQTLSVFNDLVVRFTREYGEPAQGGILVSPPFRAGQELEAIAAGKGVAASLYAFGVDNQLEGSILCQIAPNGQIVTNYQNERLNQLAISSQTGLDAPAEGMPSMQTKVVGSNSGGCFVGMLPTPYGRLAIRFYYSTAPAISSMIERSLLLRRLAYRFIVSPAFRWSFKKLTSQAS
jgi:hypothetical protein